MIDLDIPLPEGSGYSSCRNRDPAEWWAACSVSTHSASRAWRDPLGKSPRKAARADKLPLVTLS